MFEKNNQTEWLWEMVFNMEELKECDSLLQGTNRK